MEIGLCTVLKYLGLWFDDGRESRTKVAALSKLMRNVGRPRKAVKRLFMNVSSSVLQYGASVWSDTAKIPCRRVDMAKVQRKAALRCVALYRRRQFTHLARTMPIDPATEQQLVMHVTRKKAKTKREVKRAEQEIRQSSLKNPGSRPER